MTKDRIIAAGLVIAVGIPLALIALMFAHGFSGWKLPVHDPAGVIAAIIALWAMVMFVIGIIGPPSWMR